MLAAQFIGDGVKQVGFSDSGGTVNEEGVVHLPRVVGNGNGSAAGKPVGGANDEVFKCELGIEVHDGVGLPLGLIFRQFLRTKDHQADLRIEDFLHSVLDVFGTAALNNFLAEGRCGEKDQLLVVEFHHFRVVKPGGNHSRRQAVFHVI